MFEDPTGADAPPSMRSYLSVLWRRWWIILGVTAIVFGIGLARSLTQEPVYRAEGTIVLENSGQDADVQTQMRVIETPVVRNLAASNGREVGAVSTRQAGLGNVITVTADSTDPRQAARTVNATIAAYVEYSGKRGARQTAATAEAIQGRIAALQPQIDALSAQLVGGAVPPGSDLVARRDALVAQQSAFQQRLDTLQVDAASADTGIAVVGRATAPSSPITPNPRADGLIALGAGLLLGIAIAFVVEYLDDSTVKSRQQLGRLDAGVTLMGVIPAARSAYPEVVSLSAPESQTAEAYRSLRAAASAMGLGRGRCVEVTSAPGREGKTETLVNLAVLLARSGHRVIVVDCDLWEPRVHTFFGLSNEIGLTSVLRGGALSESIQRVPSVDHLFVLSSGPVPANPTDLLASPRCTEILGSLQVSGTLVLVDTPPLPTVTDAAVLAESALVDAVVLVGTEKASTRKHLRQALDMLHASGAPQVGVVLTTDDIDANEPAAPKGRRRWRPRAHRGGSTPAEPDTTLPGSRTEAGSVAAAPDTSGTAILGARQGER